MFRVMGIVNVTPDSFSDGGRCLDATARSPTGGTPHKGAAILDIGGVQRRARSLVRPTRSCGV